MEERAAETEPIKVVGRIEESDYVRAQWLHLRPRPIMAVLGILFVLLLVAGGTVQLVGWARGHGRASDSFMLPF